VPGGGAGPAHRGAGDEPARGGYISGQRLPHRFAVELVASAEFRRLRHTHLPKNSCCDRYFYRVTVAYRDTHRKTISTVQGAAAPSLLWNVMSLTGRAGAHRRNTA
jgi:hypothetical protein